MSFLKNMRGSLSRYLGSGEMGVNMEIAVVTFRLHAPWVHGLKEKRMT